MLLDHPLPLVRRWACTGTQPTSGSTRVAVLRRCSLILTRTTRLSAGRSHSLAICSSHRPQKRRGSGRIVYFAGRVVTQKPSCANGVSFSGAFLRRTIQVGSEQSTHRRRLDCSDASSIGRACVGIIRYVMRLVAHVHVHVHVRVHVCPWFSAQLSNSVDSARLTEGTR